MKPELEILTEAERDAVAAFAENTFALEAVKKYVLAVAYKQGVMRAGEDYRGNMNWALSLAWGATEPNGIPRSDEELGAHIRALTIATKLVESGFKELAEFKKVEQPLPVNENPAE